MKLLHKLLLGYILIIIFIGSFSTLLLIYTIDKNSSYLVAYRERETTSFVKVLNAVILEKNKLKDTQTIQKLFDETVEKLPHVKRLTLHVQNPENGHFKPIVSTVRKYLQIPSHQEDIDAILYKKTTLLYEKGKNGGQLLDITYPITDNNLKAIAAIGATVSLYESDKVLANAIQKMKEDTLYNILLIIMTALILSLIIGLLVIRKIISPLHTLKNAIGSFSKQEFTPIEIASNDEIGELAATFNIMADELHILYNSMQEQIDIKTKELQTQYLVDSLTTLPNRNALYEDMKKFSSFHLAILDVASFRDINDSYGVDIGNRVLQVLAQKIKFYLDNTQLKIYRLGGDEIAIINYEYNAKKFVQIIQQLIKSLEHETIYFEDKDLEINVSLHAGISLNQKSALEHANIALLEAKKSYVDLRVFNEKTHTEDIQIQNLKMIKKIKDAVNHDNFIAYYQPILNKQKEIVKYEALVRMQYNHEILSPNSFIDIAKKTKYYKYITRSIIAQAFQEFKSSTLSFSINISGDDLINQETFGFIQYHLENFSDTSRVIFEIVESEDIHHLPNLQKFIALIKKHNAKIAIDDFGTGYSNFSYLLDLEPDYIKIDGSLIKNIDHDDKSYNIVKTVVSFAHTLNIKVIAEFIHSKEVLAVCESLGIDEFQGYLFGEPSLTIVSK
ncbi:EAL domain-containing protein [Sulfurimonas indica]|uniref:EAL domain-containing protein n=1 Tax=Sulfurimonas indica TaxID=2508707 RepID=UPI0012655B67|nr:EAL domain-containing protein [Sulfurimonas indica]